MDIVDEFNYLGDDVIIHEMTSFKRKALVSIGNHVGIDFGFYCTTKLDIGDYVHISPHVSCIGGKDSKFTAMGYNNIMAGARIVCTSDRFDGSGLFGAMIPQKYKGKQIIGDVVIEELAHIGTNAIILPGSILRRGVLLSAGSLLMGDTVPYGVYKGNPATLVKVVDGTTMEKLLEQLKNEEWASNQ